MPSFALRFDLGRRTPQRRHLSRHDMRNPTSTSARATKIKLRSMPKSIAEAEHQIEEAGPSTAPALERAKEALKKGRKFISDRQKLIKIADRSEHGWGVVQEYTADELAEDSGDEKRLEKAERAAELKAAKRRKKKASPALPYSELGHEAVHQHDGANTSAQSGRPLLRVWRDGPHAHELSEGSCP